MRTCSACEASSPPEAKFCMACGTALMSSDLAPLLPRTTTLAPSWPIRQRPTWVVFLLTIFTLGLYWPIWFAQTWSELKRVVRDPGMSPVWHGLSLAVPIYNLFRVHAHFRTINDQSRL